MYLLVSLQKEEPSQAEVGMCMHYILHSAFLFLTYYWPFNVQKENTNMIQMMILA